MSEQARRRVRAHTRVTPEVGAHLTDSDQALLDIAYERARQAVLEIAVETAASESLPDDLGGLTEREWRARRAATIFTSFGYLLSVSRGVHRELIEGKSDSQA